MPSGQIKFMFPNQHAVYLHDTPSEEPVRSATSAPTAMAACGCMDPWTFADALCRSSPASTAAAQEAGRRAGARGEAAQARPGPHHLFHRLDGRLRQAPGRGTTSTAMTRRSRRLSACSRSSQPRIIAPADGRRANLARRHRLRRPSGENHAHFKRRIDLLNRRFALVLPRSAVTQICC